MDPVASSLFPALNPPAVASEGATQATPLPEGAAGKGGGKGKAATAPKASKRDTPFRRRVSDQFGEAFTEVFGTRYPWVFAGQYSDASKVTVWIEAAKIKEADPEPGLLRLRGAALAYFRAVDAGAVWPRDEKANTMRFTRDLAKWLQVDPNESPPPPPQKPNKITNLLAALARESDGVKDAKS